MCFEFVHDTCDLFSTFSAPVSQCRERYILDSIFSIVGAKHVAPAVVNAVLQLVENVLEMADERREAVDSPTREELVSVCLSDSSLALARVNLTALNNEEALIKLCSDDTPLVYGVK